MSTQAKDSINTSTLGRAKQRAGYLLAGQSFRTKREVTDAIRVILWRYPLGSRLIPEDERVLLALLQHHPHASEKYGRGVKSIRILANPIYPNQRGFFLERVDGSCMDFSYIECIQPSSPMQQVTYALRRAIEPQIVERKTRVFGGRDSILCPVSDTRCRWEEMHVDHRPPLTFAQLSKDFLASKSAKPEDVLLLSPPDGIGKVLGNPFWETEWQDYHRMFADLWVISIAAHVALTRQRLHQTQGRE